MQRRDMLKFVSAGIVAGVTPNGTGQPLENPKQTAPPGWINVRDYGARGDGAAIDSPAINRAIVAAAQQGGGTVYFPAGTYLSYSIRLKSKVGLHLDHGATILAAAPHEGDADRTYDAAEPQGNFEPYQDYGHNHWHNSLIWGEGLDNIAITGPGLIWGRYLSRGWDQETALPDARKPGVGNKAIALKNCTNVLLRDFRILNGGWFGILATGVDNLTIDNLLVDTNRDGIDIDCCRNVRVSNCTVNSPWDDAICPKSSFALGYARPTENLTIGNCLVTGSYEVGSVLDGTWKPLSAPHAWYTGRIKLGTESNGGFRNITISNCIFEGCKGLAIESEDGALVEDVTITNIAMRDLRSAPLFLRLGTRMRGPAGTKPGIMRRILISNITCFSASPLPAIIAGVPDHPIEDLRISNFIFEQTGGADAATAALQPEEREAAYPDPEMFGPLPATGIFARHVHGLSVSDFTVAVRSADARPAIWLNDVADADLFRIALPLSAPAYRLRACSHFRSFGSLRHDDVKLERVEEQTL